MKKKNFFWSVLAVMMVTMLSVNLSACSSDDDDDNEVVGTWVYVDEVHTYTWVFRSDKSGIMTEKHAHKNEEPYILEFPFTYSPTSNSEGTIIFESEDNGTKETEFRPYTVIGNKLKVYDSDGSEDYVVYTKQ